MSIGGNHIYMYFRFKYPIDKPMFFRNLSAPAILRLTFQRFGMTGSSPRMLNKFVQ